MSDICPEKDWVMQIKIEIRIKKIRAEIRTTIR